MSESFDDIQCRVLGVHRSGYYAYLKRGLGRRAEENERLVTMITAIYKYHRGRYGSPRITEDLRGQGIRCGKNRVARLMRINEIKALRTKKFCVTAQSVHPYPLAEDLVRRDFSANDLNELWVSDITYIWTWKGWMYLAAVMDVYNREIIGWMLQDHLTKDIVEKALKRAISKRSPHLGMISHSDHGKQYANYQIRKLLKERKIRQSMSGKGSCYDNAMMESFFSSLKKELVYHQTFHTKEQASRIVFEYIEIYYNWQRQYSTLNYKIPVEYYHESTQA